MNNITAIILTKNEERDLPRCITALDGFCHVVVLDSGSMDRTCELAHRLGATVLKRAFDSFGRQRNWALENNPFETEWVLFLDADEIATSSFREAVQRAVSGAGKDVSGFYCCWKMMFENIWLKRSDNFPKWQLRLVRSRKVRFVDVGHGQKEGTFDGRLDFLREPYLHYAFSKGWSGWIERHNRYSTLEARERSAGSASLREVLGAGPSLRNRRLKLIVSRIPGWPLIRFIYSYVLSGGFLDGAGALRYCAMTSYYEFMIQLKMRETSANQNIKEIEHAHIGHRVF
jgi:glycosyltransferase involved in cell wall biosynthesis